MSEGPCARFWSRNWSFEHKEPSNHSLSKVYDWNTRIKKKKQSNYCFGLYLISCRAFLSITCISIFFFQKLFRSPSAGYPRVADGFLSPLLHGGNSHVICHLQGKSPKPVSAVKSVSHKELCSKIKVSWMIRLNPVSWRGFDVHTNITWSAEIMKSVVFTQLLIRLGYFLRSVISRESCFND